MATILALTIQAVATVPQVDVPYTQPSVSQPPAIRPLVHLSEITLIKAAMPVQAMTTVLVMLSHYDMPGMYTGHKTFCFNVSGFTTSGGFKFAAVSTDSSKPSPFSLAPTASANTAPPPSGGFKFGTPATTTASSGSFTMNTAAVSKEDTPKVSPFTFGAQSANNNKVSDKSDASAAPPGGGFKFGAPSSTSSEKSSESAAQQQPPTAGGFKFNVGSSDSSSAAKPEAGPAPPPSGGFKFGVQETSEAGLKPASTAGVGGFSFGQKHDSNAAKPPVGGATGSAAPLSGGFTFGGAGGSSTATTTTVATTTGKSEAFTAPPVAAAAKTEPKVEFKPGTCCLCLVRQSKSVGFVHDAGMPLALDRWPAAARFDRLISHSIGHFSKGMNYSKMLNQ